MATIGMAQVQFNLRLDMNGKYGDMTEFELKARNELWAKTWEEETKPEIFAAVVDELNSYSNSGLGKKKNKSSNKKVFGNFPNAKYDLLIKLIKMDEDGETRALVSLSDKERGELLLCEEIQFFGKSTKNFYRITPNGFQNIARAASYKLRKIKE